MSNDFRDYLFEYRHDGSRWEIAIRAKSEDDARARVHNLQYGTLLGVKVADIPAGFGPFARLACYFQNLLTRGP